MFYRVGDWDDLQIDLHVSLHVGFKIHFAGVVPVFFEFNDEASIENIVFPLSVPVPNNWGFISQITAEFVYRLRVDY